MYKTIGTVAGFEVVLHRCQTDRGEFAWVSLYPDSEDDNPGYDFQVDEVSILIAFLRLALVELMLTPHP